MQARVVSFFSVKMSAAAAVVTCSTAGGLHPPPPPPGAPLYLVSTHKKCWDGAAAAAILVAFCATHGVECVDVPHAHGRSFLTELERAFDGRNRPTTILMFDVCPDEDLVAAVLATPSVVLVVQDHHDGVEHILTTLASRCHPRISATYDGTVSAAWLAWRWATSRLPSPDCLGFHLDVSAPRCGRFSRLLNAICMADLFLHRGQAELTAVDAALRLLHTPDTATVTALLRDPGAYDRLVASGHVCVRVQARIARDLILRGKTYVLNDTAMLAIAAAMGTDGPREPFTVFYVQGTYHFIGEMVATGIDADMVWVWSKVEVAGSKQYTVAVRRGRPSSLPCNVVAQVLGGGNGHRQAAGMAFDTEPLHFFDRGMS